MNNLIRNIRYGLRGLWKNPGFTIVAVLSLALGIGANTAIFSLVNEVLLKPLQFRDPDRLVMVWEDATFANFPRNTPAPANYADWKTQNHVFEDMAAMEWKGFNLTGNAEPQKISAYAVTANFFSLLGIQPVVGRSFTIEEDRPEANKVVMLSHRIWQTRFGGERSILNQTILLDGEKYTVIGIMPAGFQFLEPEVVMWVPIAFTPQELANRGGHYLNVVARMKPSVKLEQARADIQTIMQRIAREYPNQSFDGKLGSVVLPLRDQLAGESRRQLIMLLVAVGFVLLIACANIASLLLARAANRRREIAIRTALGASRWRIVGQLLTESVLLASAGGLAGLLFASWSFAFLQKLVPPGMALSTNLKIDVQVLGYGLLISLLTGLIFGLAPALHATNVDLNETLKQSAGRTSFGTGGNRLRNAMVMFEIAMALVLLIGAGLLIQTFFKIHSQYAFLKPENVLTMRTVLPRTKYKEHWQRTNFYDQVLARISSLPGIISAGYSTSVPLSWKGGTSGFFPEGMQRPLPGLSYDANHRQVTPEYLQAMGIPLREGRYFSQTDNAQSVPVAIINETMARQYWPNQPVLGKRFKVGDPDENVPWMMIIGVAADLRQMGVNEPVKAEMYLPQSQITAQPWFTPRDLVIRTSGDPKSLVAAVRGEIRAVDRDLPVSNIATMSELLGEETAQQRLGMILLGSFASVALLLAALGIYGVLAYFVVQHTPEIGVRMALGAQRRDVLGLVLKRGMTLAAAGIGAGLIAAFALTQLIQSLLYGIKASDPLTFAAIAFLLAIVALLACYIPARRATKVDPMVALRCE